jgi:hypothetical protein
MTIFLGLLRDELEADQEGLPTDFPTDFNRLSIKMLDFMVEEAGEDQMDQINFINQISADLQQIGQINHHNETYRLVRDQANLKPVRLRECYPEPTR